MAYAAGHLPSVRGRREQTGALNMRQRPGSCYRVAQMSDDSVADLRAGITSDDGRFTIADIASSANRLRNLADR
jgi:hypothetical protein